MTENKTVQKPSDRCVRNKEWFVDAGRSSVLPPCCCFSVSRKAPLQGGLGNTGAPSCGRFLCSWCAIESSGRPRSPRQPSPAVPSRRVPPAWPHNHMTCRCGRQNPMWPLRHILALCDGRSTFLKLLEKGAGVSSSTGTSQADVVFGLNVDSLVGSGLWCLLVL